MPIKKELLSENLKEYMDYSMEMMNSLDGAPEHSPEEVSQVNERIQQLKGYLDNLKASYNETVPQGDLPGTVIPEIVM